MLFWTALAAIFWPTDAIRAADKRVLVVNSNAQVPKFRQIEEAFAASFGGPVSSIDLGSGEEGAEARVRRELLAKSPDIVFCVGSKAYLAAIRSTQRTPIVFAAAINWRRLPASGNAFGVANELPVDFQLTTLRHVFGSLRRLGVVYSERHNEQTVALAAEAGRDVGIEIVARPIHKSADAEDAVREVLPRVDALWVIPDPTVLSLEATVDRLFAQARQAKVPVIAYDELFIGQGAVLAISADQATIGVQAALMADDVVDGQDVAKKVVDPAGSQITLDLRQLGAYRLTVNPGAAASLNRIIR